MTAANDDHDDPLRGVDLAAWQIDDPPAELARRALEAHARRAARAAAPPVEALRVRARRRMPVAMIATTISLAAAASAVLVCRAAEYQRPRGHGVTDRAANDRATAPPPYARWTHRIAGVGVANTRVQATPSAIVQLKDHGELRWDAGDRELRAQQIGAAVWQVSAPLTLSIEPLMAPAPPPLPPPFHNPNPAMTPVTVTTSNAIFHVEVTMSRSSTAAVATAIGVATVSIWVAAGDVQISGQGVSVQAAAGDTVTAQDGKPVKHDRPMDDAKRARTASPSEIRALQVSGDPAILPDAALRPVIDADLKATGKPRILGTAKTCIDTAGLVSNVSLLKSTGYDDYDRTISTTIYTWRFRPYTVDGEPAPVCTAFTVSYPPAK